MMPMDATENIATASAALPPVHWVNASAIPATSAAIAACHRRSPVLSECQPTISIPTVAHRLGIITIRLTCSVLSPASFCSIFGSQIFSP